MVNDVVGERPELTVNEICECCDITVSKVQTYVEEGLFHVEGSDAGSWRFTETCLVTMKKAVRLEQDLRLNPAGVVLAFELMQRIEMLENELKRLEKNVPSE